MAGVPSRSAMAAPISATTAATTLGGRAWGRLTDSRLRLKVMAGLAILAVWHFGVTAFAPPFVAKPLNVLAVFPSVVVEQSFIDASLNTLFAVFQGLMIALVAGTMVGIAMGRVKVFDRLLSFYVNGFYAMPMIAVLPLITIWFGYEDSARLATVVFAAFFSIAINARDGARSVPPEYLEVGRAYRAKRRHVWFDITMFSSLPYLIAGFRLAAGRALVGAVLAELFVSLPGLGMYVLSHARSFQHNEAVVGVVMLAAFGLGFEFTMTWILRHYFPWYRRDERAD
jgi:ABC-type nitrate/sulfonate/bicarbonate transport system permease component